MSWLLRLFTRKRMEVDVDRELRFHFESQVAEKMRGGISESEARRLTRLEFGGMEQIKEDCRESRGTQWFESTAQDLRYGLRQLRKSPHSRSLPSSLWLSVSGPIRASTRSFMAFSSALFRSPIRHAFIGSAIRPLVVILTSSKTTMAITIFSPTISTLN